MTTPTRFEVLCQQLLEDEGFAVDVNLFAALIVSLVAGQNVVISTKEVLYLQKSISLMATNIFGIKDVVVINCTDETTWKQTSKAMVRNGAISRIIIFSRLDQATSQFQAMLLDALVRRQVETESGVYHLPDWFLAIALVSAKKSQVNLISHMKERFFLLHQHEATENVQHKLPAPQVKTVINEKYLQTMRQRMKSLTIIADIKRYMQDIVVFLRTHRLVRKGIPTKAVKDFDLLVRTLCILHDYEYATPSIVAIAARKVFPLKIELCHPEDEPTLNYGGDISIITNWLKKWDQGLIIEDVLNSVEPPL